MTVPHSSLLICLAVCLALPAQALADTPGYKPIGPPATLGDIAFAANGTIYGTVDNGPAPSANPVVLWRSTDHGRTWRAAYRQPTGSQLAVATVSPDDPNIVYAYTSSRSVARIDVRLARATPLSFTRLLGVDAAGTAYGRLDSASGASLVRCRDTADACETVPGPAFASGAIVDPNSAAVLTATAPNGRLTSLEVSTDGGTTWAEGARVTCCRLSFAGPAPRTLVALADGQLSVSHNAGLTWDDVRPAAASPLVVGTKPAAVIGRSSGGPLQFSADEGASFRPVGVPIPGTPVVDPTDANRFFMVEGDSTQFTADGGKSWRDIGDARFGTLGVEPSLIAGSGRSLYLVGTDSLWESGDMGATWSRFQRPDGANDYRIVVSRDDPRIAYVQTSLAGVAGELRTGDGGATWEPVTPPPAGDGVTWITPGDPLHVYALQQSFSESTDGGATWKPGSLEKGCALSVVADPTSPTGQRLRCSPWLPGDPIRPLTPPLPYAPGIVGSPGLPGVYAVSFGETVTRQLLGDLRADWSWTSMLEQTGGFGPGPGNPLANGAWPAAGGTTFYSTSVGSTTVWVRQGAGRWWRLQQAGQDVHLSAVLDRTHALVVPANGAFGLAGVLDLAHPAVSPPAVKPGPGGLTCAVPWSAADADTAAFAWLRDGNAAPGAGGPQYAPAARDRGHALTCRATARTDFGSSVVSSDAYPIAPAHLSITGVPRAGSRLRCGAARRITWFRDGRALKGRHAPVYRIRSADRGHGLACQTRRPDGGIGRSRDVRIAKAQT